MQQNYKKRMLLILSQDTSWMAIFLLVGRIQIIVTMMENTALWILMDGDLPKELI